MKKPKCCEYNPGAHKKHFLVVINPAKICGKLGCFKTGKKLSQNTLAYHDFCHSIKSSSMTNRLAG